MEFREHNGWLSNDGPDNDIVLSSRARLARNLSDFPFVCKADTTQRSEILSIAKRAILDAKLDETMLWVELNHATPHDRKLLVERHLISAQLANGEAPRAVAVSGNESLSIMVNEEDHLRMQVLMPGYQVASAYKKINAVDDALEERLAYAFSDRFGYLTACPTNVGTGLRLGVMVHLPALKLTGEIDRVQRASKDLQLAVRGFFGEGSESAGDFYQVSNQITLGVTEQALLTQFKTDIVPRLIEYERASRKILLERRATMLEDRVHRALGILRSARMLGNEEAMKLLSRVRLGVHMGLIKDINASVVDRLFPQIQTAHLQQMGGEQLDKESLKEARANLVSKALITMN